MEFIDTHAHLNLIPKNGREEVIARARQASVTTIVVIGIDLRSSLSAVDIASKHDGVFATVGIHPHEAISVNAGMLSQLSELAALPKVVAIGETGLDYYRDLSPRDAQKEVFRRQIELAIKTGLPIIVHDREAHEETLEILESEGAVSVLMHCFSGDVSLAKTCAKRGYMIAAGGRVTYDSEVNLREAFREVPIENILLETDCPYLVPYPLRGKNEPAYIYLVNEALAKVRSTTAEEIARETSKNALRFLSLDR